MHFFSRQKGFSRVLLLLFVAIFALLVALVIPQFKSDQSSKTISGHTAEESKSKVLRVSANKSHWPPVEVEVGALDNYMLRRNYYVILDGSGSMADNQCSGSQSKFQSAIGAIERFVNSVPPEDNIGLLIFDTQKLSERVPLGVGNRTKISQALRISQPGGGTPLSDAVEKGYLALTKQASQQLGYGEYHMVIVTDGEASLGYDPIDSVNRIVDDTAIVIHTIGYCIDEGHSLNQPGKTLYTTVDNAESLSRELNAVLAESESFDVSQFQ